MTSTDVISERKGQDLNSEQEIRWEAESTTGYYAE
jgi:hypothetical protein